jgi:hypothetical protein
MIVTTAQRLLAHEKNDYIGTVFGIAFDFGRPQLEADALLRRDGHVLMTKRTGPNSGSAPLCGGSAPLHRYEVRRHGFAVSAGSNLRY